MSLREPFGLAAPPTTARGVAIAESHEPVAFEPLDPLVIGLVIALAMRDGDLDRLSLRILAVKAVSFRSTRKCCILQTKRRLALRISTPGRRPLSQRI